MTTKRTLAREDWVEAARKELIARGVAAVAVVRLARNLRVTRGSFYWHFSNHQELLRALLQLWEHSNTRPFEEALTREGPRIGHQEFFSIINLYLEEDRYNPAFDTAVRNWARTSKVAAAAVRRVDARRIEILHRIFIDLGYADPEALVRARITYFHQVGYYAIDVQEDPEIRRSLVPVYIRVLVGKSSDAVNATGPATCETTTAAEALDAAAPAVLQKGQM